MQTFSKSTIQENRKIFFNSDKANLTLSKSHLFYYLNEPIQVLAGHYIFLTLLDGYIPVSFYQQKDVVLSGSIGASNFSFQILCLCPTIFPKGAATIAVLIFGKDFLMFLLRVKNYLHPFQENKTYKNHHLVFHHSN